MTSSLLGVRLGSQTPRVANYPAHPFSVAPECIDAAADFGLILDPWQCWVLEHGLGQTLDERWTATRVGCWVPRQNGKGGIVEALILYWLFFTDEQEIVYSAHQDITAAKMWDRVCRLVMSAPEYHDLVLGSAYDALGRPDLAKTTGYRARPGERAVELADGRKVEFATRSGSRMRGFTVGKLIFDEAQELDSDQMNALLPTLSAIRGQQSWYFGTAPTDPTAWCYGLKDDGEAGDTPRLAWLDWGLDWVDITAPDGRAKVLDLDTWYACNPALGIRIELETVEDESRPSGLDVPGFAQERLGMWQPRSAGASAIPKATWEALARPKADRPRDIAFGVVVSPSRAKTAIVACGPGEGGLLLSVAEHRDGTWWVPDWLAERKAKWNPVAISVEDKALLADCKARGLLPAEDVAHPKRGDLAIMSASTDTAAFGMLVDRVGQKTIHHVGDEMLDVSVSLTPARRGLTGSTWDSRIEQSALIRAAAHALWAYLTRVDAIPAYDPLANFG